MFYAGHWAPNNNPFYAKRQTRALANNAHIKPAYSYHCRDDPSRCPLCTSDYTITARRPLPLRGLGSALVIFRAFYTYTERDTRTLDTRIHLNVCSAAVVTLVCTSTFCPSFFNAASSWSPSRDSSSAASAPIHSIILNYLWVMKRHYIFSISPSSSFCVGFYKLYTF